ncbi:MAG TPA: large conductance mechanosensitive channel protein MscL [Flavobacteriales bacterium]|nr:large conductance mechanosensitive channel protein MscL [Flavobacteriales bacterium]|tara:strand:+ start:7552 stop:7962 length:411 start_codon:yes stop_codon:yes gene_type:complete
MLKEFKNFIMTGNVIEFAIAVILAGAVGLTVKGFVNMIMMPIIGYFAGGTNFSELFIVLGGAEFATLKEALDSGAAVIQWGSWVNTLINLVIVGFVLFMMAKAYKKTKKKEEATAPAPAGPSDNALLIEIRDALKK